MVCTSASGRPTRPCLDPWPEVYNFQVSPDRSIEPPAEPLPVRWGLDNIWSASAIKQAPDDATRVNAFLGMHYQQPATASFESYRVSLPANQDVVSVTTINPDPAKWDGLFVPSNSVRTVVPQPAPASNVNKELASGDAIVSVPWATAKGI